MNNSEPRSPADKETFEEHYLMATRWLTALPVYNERQYVTGVLDQVCRFSQDVLVVDDGSTDGTSALLAQRQGIRCVCHAENRGYGAALSTAFEYAVHHNYDVLVTIDCDGQHEPQRIPDFAAACRDVELVSGSRYLELFPEDTAPPEQRRRINQHITQHLRRELGLNITDAFCGFKAYRVDALRQLELTEEGYAMPLELWVQAARLGWRIVELPVPLIYLDETRSFGGALDDGQTRLAYYHQVLQRSLSAPWPSRRPTTASCRDGAG